MWKKILAAVAVAGGVAMGATPAAALDLVFNVDVVDASGVAGFAPFSFQQTWTFGPGTPGDPSGAAPAIVGGGRFGGSATATASPVARNLTDGPLAAVGAFSASGGYDFVSAVSAPFPGISIGVTTANASYERRLTIAFGGIVGVMSDAVTLSSLRFEPGRVTPAFSADEAGLVAYFAAAPFRWTETQRDEALGIARTVSYSGVATFVQPDVGTGPPLPPSGAPESAGWTLLIAGFGGVGGLMRRRRAAVA